MELVKSEEDNEDEMKLLFSRREFLNLPGHHSTASIVLQAITESWHPAHVELMINDCNKIITLAVDVETKQSYENTIHKINTLVDVLSSFQKVLPELRETYLRIEAERKKEKEDKKKEEEKKEQ